MSLPFTALVLRGTTYQHNSNVTLEDIGEGYDALLCITNQTACCQPPYTGEMGQRAIGNWFFPNGTRVPSRGSNWDFYRTRGQMVVRMNRRRGGVEGIYRCEIPDAMNVTQTIYIGMYSASTGEWYMQCILPLEFPQTTLRIVKYYIGQSRAHLAVSTE